jgi:transcriptional regulator GlxA family with amidase domain
LTSSSVFSVAVLLYDGCIAAEAFAVADVLHMANAVAQRQVPGRPPVFAVSLVSVGGSAVRVSAGVKIDAGRYSRPADLVVVPGFSFGSIDELLARLDQLTREVRFIRRLHRSNRSVASICVGAFVLAEAGVLTGRRATTAWIAGAAFKKRYPDILLDLDQLMVRDGRIWTTAAVTAAYDLVLQLVRVHANSDLAAVLSKIILLGQDRRLQSPFVLADLDNVSRSDVVSRACHQLRRRVGDAFDLTQLAAMCATSKRTLNRQFRREMGCTPLTFCHRVKIERAKTLLETTRLRISEIPGRLGYADESTFRMIFTRETGETPSRYRQRFRRI